MARISGIGLLGLSLTVPMVAAAQGAVPSQRPGSSDVGPIAVDTALNAGRNEPASGAGGGDPQKKGETAESPAPSASKASGGYSWPHKKAQHKVAPKRAALDPSRPLVLAPSFQIRSDGTTVVLVAVSGTTEVIQKVIGRHVVYLLKRAQVGVQNNLNPLITSHFPTPLVRVVLERDKDGIALVLVLRENAQPAYQIRNGPGGTAVLEVTLPRPSHVYPSEPSPVSEQRVSAETASSSLPDRKAKSKKPTAATGPGPRL